MIFLAIYNLIIASALSVYGLKKYKDNTTKIAMAIFQFPIILFAVLYIVLCVV